MHPAVFNPLREYLARGDVRGVFSKVLKDTEAILDQLYSIKEILEADKVPEIETTWKLNQTFSDYLLFGQYAAMVFKEMI
jgi:hypothetical protein